jgi:hypothetical protein
VEELAIVVQVVWLLCCVIEIASVCLRRLPVAAASEGPRNAGGTFTREPAADWANRVSSCISAVA